MRDVLRTRRVRLLVQNVPEALMPDYHGRDAALIGETVDAVELERQGGADGVVVAYVDDRDGVASELVEAVGYAEAVALRGPAIDRHRERMRRELEDHAKRRFLHGDVMGVRT
jgi:hypothetical protein